MKNNAIKTFNHEETNFLDDLSIKISKSNDLLRNTKLEIIDSVVQAIYDGKADLTYRNYGDENTQCRVSLTFNLSFDTHRIHNSYCNVMPVLRELEIWEIFNNCYGKSEKDGKWYGWSHRAIYGFEIGSHVKIGDCGFVPANKDDFLAKEKNFWSDSYTNFTLTDGGVEKTYIESGKKELIPFPETWGRGEWIAETEEDAKQMAKDFADCVS